MSPSVVESDEKPPDRFRRLIVQLEMAKQELGEGLTPAELARRTDEINRVWWTMTDAEQTDYERAIGRTIAKVWRKGKIVQLPPSPSSPPRVPPSWLREELLTPRWMLLLAWLVHGGLCFLLGWLVR